MSNLLLFSLRPFPIWNINIPAGKEFEISDWIGKQLIARGVCIEQSVRAANIEAKAVRKAEEARIKAEQEAKSKESEEPKPEKKKKGGKE